MLVIGAGGFARQLLDVLEQGSIPPELVFFDDVSGGAQEKLYGVYKIFRSLSEVEEYFKTVTPHFCLGLGGPENRRKMDGKFSALGGELQTVISPLSRIGKHDIRIDPGVTILTGSIVENGACIGRGSLVNLNCTITHDCVIGEFCEISPGAHLSGRCRIGNGCFVGTGAVLLPGIKLGDNVVIGAGSVVTRDVPSGQTFVGVPAKKRG